MHYQLQISRQSQTDHVTIRTRHCRLLEHRNPVQPLMGEYLSTHHAQNLRLASTRSLNTNELK
jgi:hypothetical protein